jgi:hypothetical protein
MTCLEIIKKYLIENGYDGLQDECECGCSLDSLAACGNSMDTCEPAYKHECSKCKDHCYNYNANPKYGYCMKPDKQK